MKKEWQKQLYFKGKLDCLYFYSKHIKEIAKFIKNKEIATKITLAKNMVFLRRGSKDPALFAKEMNKNILTNDFFDLRSRMKRADAVEKKLLTKTQEKIWLYFPPNKPVEFFYACNGEGQGKKIERIFIDIDRSNLSSEKAKQVTKALVKEIKNDREFNKLLKFKIKVLFTGSSYHVYLMLNKPVSLNFYNRYIAYSKTNPLESFIGRWAQKLTDKMGINVFGGHEKIKNVITLDPSQTPSGKLARAPFSVHVKNGKIDGIAKFIEL